VTAQQPAAKKYIVKLSAEEREQLNALIQKGKGRVRQALKARILLKADTSEAGDAWSDSQIAAALDTSVDTIARTRQQLVEGGSDAALTRRHSPKLLPFALHRHRSYGQWSVPRRGCWLRPPSLPDVRDRCRLISLCVPL
jgi:hypothetical protein